MDIFEACSKLNDLFESGKDAEARDELIKLLDHMEQQDSPYDELLNRMIRKSGLYPYLRPQTSTWEDRCAYEAFKVDVGLDTPITLHREQSAVLRKLIDGESIAVSAPTSFGKSFIIDAFIAIREPKNVIIIIPTLALTDETRRRLQRKFAGKYKIITTSDSNLEEKNILIFPQERAIGYAETIEELDLLVIDEFYKASPKFDKDRAPSLLRAILKLSEKAKQKYFLAPNISQLADSIFTKGVEFIPVKFNTVFLEKHELYREMGKNEELKSNFLIKLLKETQGKTLVYAATYSNITSLSNLITDRMPILENPKLHEFEFWLSVNYEKNWHLTNLVKRGIGIHNGQLHRPLSQIQIKLFEEEDGLNTIVSTSSIIEGVNTSAENIVIWSNKKGGRGNPKLDDFMYKNIIGRGGRMFRHFIGKIYILEEPPKATETPLELEISDELIGSIDQDKYSQDLNPSEIEKIIAYKEEIKAAIGAENSDELLKTNIFQTSDSTTIKTIINSIISEEHEWNGLVYLNTSNPENWDRLLYKFLKLLPGAWGTEYSKIVEFIKIISQNWIKSIPQMLDELDEFDIGLDEFFKLERSITYNLAALISDVSIIHGKITKSNIDITPFIAKISHAFLPPNVFKLEEYGLPRMISRKIHNSGLIDLTESDISLHETIDRFLNVGLIRIQKSVKTLDNFDLFVLKYFYEGIQRD